LQGERKQLIEEQTRAKASETKSAPPLRAAESLALNPVAVLKPSAIPSAPLGERRENVAVASTAASKIPKPKSSSASVVVDGEHRVVIGAPGHLRAPTTTTTSSHGALSILKH